MSALRTLISHFAGTPLGTIVHLGAGSGACVEAYADLQMQRLHLVEGDTDSAEALSEVVSANPAIEVHSIAIGPNASVVTWYRYNVRALNGPLPAKPLQTLFPRLRQLSAKERQVESVTELLQQLKPASDEGTNLLVIDLPGQEIEILAAIGDPRMLGFEHVLVRAAGEHTYPGAKGIAPIAAALRDHHFGIRESDVVTDPVWPALWLAFDEHAARNAARLAEVDALRRQISSLRRQIEAANDEKKTLENDKLQIMQNLVSLREELEKKSQGEVSCSAELVKLQAGYKDLHEELAAQSKRRAEAEQVAKERAAEIDALGKSRDEQVKIANDRAAELKQAHEAKFAAEKTATELAAQIAALIKSRDEQAKLTSAQAAELALAHQAKVAAEKVAVEQAALVEAMTKSRDEQAKLANERTSELTKAQQAKASAEKAVGDSKASIQQLVIARDDQEKQLAVAIKKNEELQAENSAIALTVIDQERRLQAIQRELERAEAQLSLIKELMKVEPL